MKKAAIGTFAALALLASTTGSALAFGGVKADAEARGHVGIGKLLGFGHGDGDVRKGSRRFHAAAQVTAIADGTYVAETRGGTTWTVRTDADTKLVARGHGDGELKLGTWIVFTGSVTDGEGDERSIEADAIHYWNAKDVEKKRKIGGTIESVNEAEGTFVVATPFHGDVTVTADEDTAIRAGGEAGTFADLVAGAKVRVKGAWDAISKTFVAIKVKVAG